VIFGLQWPALVHHSPDVPSRTLRPSSVVKCMSFADTSIRGACLNWRFAVNGIQKDSSDWSLAFMTEGLGSGSGIV
jgi:hypothetical protein